MTRPRAEPRSCGMSNVYPVKLKNHLTCGAGYGWCDARALDPRQSSGSLRARERAESAASRPGAIERITRQRIEVPSPALAWRDHSIAAAINELTRKSMLVSMNA